MASIAGVASKAEVVPVAAVVSKAVVALIAATANRAVVPVPAGRYRQAPPGPKGKRLPNGTRMMLRRNRVLQVPEGSASRAVSDNHTPG
eukprot:1161820-Pelagomonas_calceolata.AAC.9